MKVLILAGGFGRRLGHYAVELPKPMLPVAGKPFLEHIVVSLISQGFPEIILCTGYRHDAIEGHFGDGRRWGASISYSRETSPRGTGGAIAEASHRLDDENFIVVNGDSVLALDLLALVRRHGELGALATLACALVPDVSRFGRVVLNEDGRVCKFLEKEESGGGVVNGGIYVMSHELLALLPAGQSSLERDVLPLAIESGLWGVVVDGYFLDIGIPEDYERIRDNPIPFLTALHHYS